MESNVIIFYKIPLDSVVEVLGKKVNAIDE